MGNTNITLNAVPNEVSLSDLLNLLKKEIFFDLNCHHLATIQSFDSVKQTVTATVNYSKTIFELNETSGVYNPIQVSYPLLVDVPIIIIGGGTVRMTFPIKKGDQCLVLFNDRNIDNWFQSGQAGPVATSRAHSFADGIALVGPNSLASTIAAYDATRALLTNGTVKLGINPSNNKLVLTNGTSLNTLLQNLCTQLQALTTALAALTVSGVTTGAGVSGVPVNAATISNVGTQIGTIATNIGSLIE